MTWGDVYWPLFILIVSVAFLAPEIYALFTNDANTLSWYAWTELHVPLAGQHWAKTAAWFLSQGAFLVIVAWLLFHIWYHKFT